MSHITVSREVEDLTSFIDEGRIVAFPTGTSYGLACDALQGWALQRLRNLKRRPDSKPFTIFLDESLYDTYLSLSSDHYQAIAAWRGMPVTLLVPAAADVRHLEHGGFVALRLIDHPLMKALAATARVPLTATSANKSGEPPCMDISCVEASFAALDRSVYTYDLSLAGILDGGTLPHSLPSTIVRLDDGDIVVVRAGAVSQDELHLAQ